MVCFFDEVDIIEYLVKWFILMSLGIDYNCQYQIDYSLIVLNDICDQFCEKVGNLVNIQLVDDQCICEYEVLYEECCMYINQLKGMYIFLSFGFMGVDWKYLLGCLLCNVLGNMEVCFILIDENQDGVYDKVNESVLINV